MSRTPLTDRPIGKSVWEIETLRGASRCRLSKGEIILKPYSVGWGRWRYIQPGQVVQQIPFLHLFQADPEERRWIKIRS